MANYVLLLARYVMCNSPIADHVACDVTLKVISASFKLLLYHHACHEF
jgi:hypothetical protein